MAFEIRVPRTMALGRLAPSAVRVIRSAPSRLHVRPESDGHGSPEVPAVDVELEVRERLYGTRSSSRQSIIWAVRDPQHGGLPTWELIELWARKWRWYERNSLPWNRARIHLELMRRGAFARWPVHGNVLEAFRDGRLEIGEHTLLEPHVWITAPGSSRVRIGSGTFLNLGVMVAALELVEIGDHCMFANGCFISDSNHRFDDRHRPVPWQGFTSKGPTRVGDNVWCGANVVIASGVDIGERSVIGANSVVTADLPPYSIAAGAPARVLRTIEY